MEMNWVPEAPASSPMAPPARQKKFTKEAWDAHKPFIEEWYPIKDMTLPKIVGLLHEMGFFANERQLKRKIIDWGIEKNVKSDEMRIVAKKREKRRGQGKTTSFRIRGYRVEEHKIDRWMKKEGMPIFVGSQDVVMSSPAPTTPTPSIISYNTISEAGSPSLYIDPGSMKMAQQTAHLAGLQRQSRASSYLADEDPQMVSFTPKPASVDGRSENAVSIFEGQSPAPFTAPPSPAISLARPKQSLHLRVDEQDDSEHDATMNRNPLNPKTRYRQNDELDLQERLAAFRRQYGPDHPVSLDTLERLVLVHVEQGRYRTAEIECNELVERNTRVGGEDDPRTLASLSRRGRILSRQGKIKASATLLRDVHNRASLILSPSDSTLAIITQDFADVLITQGYDEEAEKLLQGSLSSIKSGRQPDDEALLLTMMQLGAVLARMRKFDESENMLRQVNLSRTLSLGLDHLDTLATTFNLCSVLVQSKKYEEAETKLRDLCIRQSKILGPEHPYALQTSGRRAYALAGLGQYDESEAIFREVIQKQSRICGPKHADTLSSKRRLVDTLACQERYGEAEALAKEVIALCDKAFGSESLQIFLGMQTLAQVYGKQERFDEALNLLGKALGDLTRCFGADNLNTRGCLAEYNSAFEGKERAGNASANPWVVGEAAIANPLWVNEQVAQK